MKYSTGQMSVIGFLALLLIAACMFPFVSAVDPTGAQVANPITTRAPNDTAMNNSALAGNVTDITLFVYSVTQTWQGYYGNVTGVIQLADGLDNVMYNWTALQPQGEVYASMNSSINWRNIQCLNLSAEGTYADDTGQAGATSLYGVNVTFLNTQFDINESAYDGINETFGFGAAKAVPNLLSGFPHKPFFTANRQFDSGECISGNIYDSSGDNVDTHFEEVLLYEPDSTSVIYAGILENDRAGFDGYTHDFEMLVLENGHRTDVTSTPYYFFVELE